MNRKSQMEIMGLALVVLILSIAMVFLFKFSGGSKVSEVKQDFVDTKLASNMLNVILKTTHEEKDIELKNMFKYCAEGDSNASRGYDPCDEMNKTVSFILDRTLKTWQKSYNLTATINGETKLYLINKNCGGSLKGFSTRESETYMIPTRYGTMLIRMDICR
ncbi:MAG: hypothetical protein ABIG95_01320 [Candidatus Woesearchaeota archaeon]